MDEYSSMGQFRKEMSQLGMGAFGEALRVVDQLNQNLVLVVKKIDIERCIGIAINKLGESRETAKTKILKEADLMMSLSHEHIVSVYCSFEEDNYFHIVMEYCPEGSLRNDINEKKRAQGGLKYFKEDDIRIWLAQLASALVYLHDRKILHRDIKPENIFRMSQKSVKLGDFGIAKEMTTALGNAGTAVGTCPYMSPESFGSDGYALKHDTWALGVVAYEIAALALPFGMEGIKNQYGCIQAILNGELSSLPESGQFSRDLSHLILNNMLVRPVDERATMVEVTEHRALKAEVRRVQIKAEIKKEKEVDEWKRNASLAIERLNQELAEQKTKDNEWKREANERIRKLQQELAEQSKVQVQAVPSSFLWKQQQLDEKRSKMSEEEKAKVDKDLYDAAEMGISSLAIDKAESAIDRGAINAGYRCETYGETALHRAAVKGDDKILKMILKIPNTDINCLNNFNSTPLIRAAYHRNLEAVKYLVKQGAKLNVRNVYQQTALGDAIKIQHQAMVDYLVRIGAEQ